MVISSWFFWGFVILSLFAVWFFYRGVKLNVKRARAIAEALERALEPEDKLYTWLGGVIGFSADYRVKGFDRVKANLRMVPRHVLFWLPINLLLRRRDNLQLLFFLNIPVSGEFHVVREGLFMPKIYNRDRLQREKLSEKGIVLFFDTKKPEKKVLRALQAVDGIFRHIALTPEKRVFYCSLDVEDPSGLEDAVSSLVAYLRGIRRL